MKEGDLYSILGLEPDAGLEELKRAYRFLLKKYHPDLSGSEATGLRVARIVKAYKLLNVKAQKEGYLESRVPSLKTSIEELRNDLYSLGEMLANSESRDSRVFAARELGYSGKKAAWVFLRKALYDKDELVSRTAVRSIALLGILQSAGEVAALYSRSALAQRLLLLGVAIDSGEMLFKPMIEVARNDEDAEARIKACKFEVNKGA